MPDTELLKREVLSLSPDAPVDKVADAITRVDFLMKAAREVKALLEERVLEHVTEHGPIEIGEVRYFAGTEKTTTCTDVRGAIEAVFDAAGGDMDIICQQLASQPLKYAAVKALIGQPRWQEFFKVTERPDLQTGKPARKLLSVNQKYAGAGR